MAAIAERIAIIESQVEELREKYAALDKKHDDMRQAMEQQKLETAGLGKDISKLTDALIEHNKMHEKKDESKFNWWNLGLALLLAFLTIVTFVQNQTAKDMQTQIMTYMKENSK